MNPLALQNLTVGYDRRAIVRDISLELAPGQMTGILGANGSGKTTLLKTVAGILPRLGGQVLIAGRALEHYRQPDLARQMAAVLTNRIDLADMTGFAVAAMGRYPHTGFFGILTGEDRRIVRDCLARCGAANLADRPFDQMSDGEKQKVLIARGLAQDPAVLLLDEPTSHLDIRFKLEILGTLRQLCVQDGKTVICTLHEPELAVKCCDQLILVQDDRILACGPTEEILASGRLDTLYGLAGNPFGSAAGLYEFPAARSADIFIIGADEGTPALLRQLNRRQVGIAAGVWHRNDISYHIARTMGIRVVAVDAYAPVTERDANLAFDLASQYRQILVSRSPWCAINARNRELADRLEKSGKNLVPADRATSITGGIQHEDR